MPMGTFQPIRFSRAKRIRLAVQSLTPSNSSRFSKSERLRVVDCPACETGGTIHIPWADDKPNMKCRRCNGAGYIVAHEFVHQRRWLWRAAFILGLAAAVAAVLLFGRF